MRQSFAAWVLALAIGLVGWPLAPARAQVLSGTVAAGTNHALSIRADGTLWATGGNNGGQLGDGTTSARSAWAQVGTATNWRQVAAGNFFSLGLRTDGTLWAWGLNYSGQLGRATNSGTVTANPVPTQVPGTYTQVAAGWEHTLALRADGSLWAWGSNYHGELGNSLNVNSSAPNPVPAQVPGTYTQVDAGTDCSLALRADGTLWSWGNNMMGQLGTTQNVGQNTYNPVPTQVAGTYTQVTAGAFHCLALRADGTLWAWGNNHFGSLGTATNNGTDAPNAVPTPVAGLYASASAGFYHSLALRADGTLWAWGLNDAGQLAAAPGTGPTTPFAVPTPVAGTYVQLATGYHFSLALRANGTLLAWGDNGHGQLGNATNVGTTAPNPVPAATGTALPTRSTASNYITSYAIRGDGSLWSWGSNLYGQLGDGTTAGRTRPGRVGTDTDWVQVVAGSSHALALKADGSVWAWGRSSYNQASPGPAATVPVPTRLPGYTFVRLAAGANFNLGLSVAGTLYAWGDNSHGQLGTGSPAASLPTPTLVSGGLAFGSMAAGGDFALGLTATGQVFGWGYNQFGQVGVPVGAAGAYDVPLPTPVAGLPALRQVSAGYVHSLGLAATGAAYGWGFNEVGQLGVPAGSGTTAPTATPLALAGLPPLRQLEAYSAHSLGLAAGGTIYSWGYNASGMLAQGTFNLNPNPVPTPEATASTAWAQLGTGSSAISSLVRTASAQTVASAGDNYYGQLGDGTSTNWPRFDRLSPLASLQPLPVLGAAGGGAFGLVPNPTRGLATAVGLPAATTLAVYDGLGRLLRLSSGPTLDAAGLPAGLYLVRATAPGQPPRTARLAVE